MKAFGVNGLKPAAVRKKKSDVKFDAMNEGSGSGSWKGTEMLIPEKHMKSKAQSMSDSKKRPKF